VSVSAKRVDKGARRRLERFVDDRFRLCDDARGVDELDWTTC
jgi:hypothetical protein